MIKNSWALLRITVALDCQLWKIPRYSYCNITSNFAAVKNSKKPLSSVVRKMVSFTKFISRGGRTLRKS